MIYSPMFEQALTYVWDAEGGYQNDSVDTGNWLNGQNVGTNMGITAQTLAGYLGRNVTPEEMRNLSKSTAKEIYFNRYWLPSNASKLKSSVAIPYFDAVVNTGKSGGAKILQRAVNSISRKEISVDGVVGNETIRAANKLNQNKLRKAFLEQWKQYYLDLIDKNPVYLKYKNGWLNRVNEHPDELVFFEKRENILYGLLALVVLIVVLYFLFVKFG